MGLVSENALFDSITGLSLLIALYYALTGPGLRGRTSAAGCSPACGTSLLLGVGPLTGAAMLAWLLVLSVRDLADAENSYTGQAWLGVGPPLVIGVGVMVAGVGADAVVAPARHRLLAGATLGRAGRSVVGPSLPQQLDGGRDPRGPRRPGWPRCAPGGGPRTGSCPSSASKAGPRRGLGGQGRGEVVGDGDGGAGPA